MPGFWIDYRKTSSPPKDTCTWRTTNKFYTWWRSFVCSIHSPSEVSLLFYFNLQIFSKIVVIILTNNNIYLDLIWERGRNAFDIPPFPIILFLLLYLTYPHIFFLHLFLTMYIELQQSLKQKTDSEVFDKILNFKPKFLSYCRMSDEVCWQTVSVIEAKHIKIKYTHKISIKCRGKRLTITLCQMF